MRKCFDPINVDDFSRRFSLCQRFLHISHQMMSYIDFSNFHFFNFFQFRAMKLPLRPPCRANFFASFGPVYSLIGPIWTDFIKNPKIHIYIYIYTLFFFRKRLFYRMMARYRVSTVVGGQFLGFRSGFRR